MRNVAKSMLAAAVAAVGFGACASALSVNSVVDDILTGKYRSGGNPTLLNYSGAITVKYFNFDVGQIYTTADGTYGRAVPVNANESNAVAIGQMDAVTTSTPASFSLGAGEDSWGIAIVDTIWNADQTVRLWSSAVAPYEITGMLWGEQDTYLNQTNSATQQIHGVNMKSAFWADDSAAVFDSTGGPSARTGTASYPGATEGVLLWTGNSVPGADANFDGVGLGDPGPDEFFTNFNPSANPGDSNVGDGKALFEFGTNAAGTGGANAFFGDPLGPDASVKFTGTSPQGAAGWLVQSNDPLIIAVPTPSAIYGGLVLGGLLGFGALRRRKSA